MGLDGIFLIISGGVLLFAFFSLIIGNLFIRKKTTHHALNTLGIVSFAFLIALVLAMVAFNVRINLLQDQIYELEKKIDIAPEAPNP